MTPNAGRQPVHHNGPGPSARTVLAVLTGKAAGLVSRRLGRGGGTALPGLLAERIDPKVVERLTARIDAPRLFITGTNGKTTTARLLGSVLRAAGYDPIRNGAGSNLMRGVAATLLDAASPLGSLRTNRPAVFEIDEATLFDAASAIKPDLIVFTNLFRDQLDRYGEIDSVASVWRQTLATLPATATVVLNADDPLVAGLRSGIAARVVTYGISDPSVALGKAEHAADSRWCLECERDYAYDALFFGHIGWWRCPSCGNRRPQPDVQVRELELSGDERIRFTLVARGREKAIELSLAGLYNVENALAAAAAAHALDMPLDLIAKGLESATAAFGRQERLSVNGVEVRMLLGKNPAGLNQTLRTIALADGMKDIVFALNDDIADGTDVSWIWDVDYELLGGQTRRVVATGHRAEDLALRLKYAGFKNIEIERDVPKALQSALGQAGGALYVVPTYTAMLEAREVLGRWASAGHFWERAS